MDNRQKVGEIWRLQAAPDSVWKSHIHYVCLFRWCWQSERSRRSQPVRTETKGTASGLIYTTKRHFTASDLGPTFFFFLFFCLAKFCQVYVAPAAKRKYSCITSCYCWPMCSLYIRLRSPHLSPIGGPTRDVNRFKVVSSTKVGTGSRGLTWFQCCVALCKLN